MNYINTGNILPVQASILESCCAVRNGELIVESLPVSEIVRRYGTPLFVYIPAIFSRKLLMLRDAFPDFDVYYSVKANPTPAIVNFFVRENCGLEIASSGELELALACGCSPDRILFAGPGKTDSELERAISVGVSEIHVESLGEMNRIEKLANRFDRQIPVVIRFNPSDTARGGAMNMGGKSTAFGIDEDLLAEAVGQVLQSKYLSFNGLHCYAGTQIVDYDVLVTMYEHYLNIAANIVDFFEVPMRTLDFGGGFGVPYFDTDIELDLDKLRESVTPLIERARTSKWLAQTKFIVEPGRFLVAEGGLYIATIIDIKTSRGQTYLVLDGGMNHHIVSTGHFGGLIKRNVPMAVANRMDRTSDNTYTIVGPLCTPLDTLGRNVSMPEVEVGDPVVFFQSGAYVRSQSPLKFLSRPEPMEIAVRNGEADIIRHRGKDSDVLTGTSYDPGV